MTGALDRYRGALERAIERLACGERLADEIERELAELEQAPIERGCAGRAARRPRAARARVAPTIVGSRTTLANVLGSTDLVSNLGRDAKRFTRLPTRRGHVCALPSTRRQEICLRTRSGASSAAAPLWIGKSTHVERRARPPPARAVVVGSCRVRL
jgi:hypothetical protein